MSAPPIIKGLSAIAGSYDALLCDAWGVIHDGRRLFPGVEEALLAFRRERGPVVVLTNAPKPAHVIAPQLDRLGLSRDAYDAIVTSGEATRAEMQKRAGSPVFRIGWDTDQVLYEGLDVEFAPIEKAAYIVCTGLAEEYRDDPRAYRPLLADAARDRKTMICANPDLVVRWNGKLMHCAGSVAREYEAMGGPVVYAGKPHPAVYDLSYRRIETVAGLAAGSFDPARALAVGDGAGTDVLGANRQGVDAVYIAGEGGVHVGGADGGAIASALDAAGACAVAAMAGLKW